MGCDIHFVVERKEADSEWVGVWASDHLPRVNRPRVKQRDYDFFAELARVRGSTETSLDRRGWPKQPSRLAWLLFQRAITDYSKRPA